MITNMEKWYEAQCYKVNDAENTMLKLSAILAKFPSSSNLKNHEDAETAYHKALDELKKLGRVISEM